MDQLLAELHRYLRDALGIDVAISPRERRNLPLFLEERYAFYDSEILTLPCLLMADRGAEDVPPATLRKHIRQVRTQWGEPVVYVRERITAYHRKRLVEQRVPFIVPGTQLYLPYLGIDFREHFRKAVSNPDRLRPSSQAVLLHSLLTDAGDLNPTALASKLGYSAMTMSRALDELEAAGLGESSTTGRGRERRFRPRGAGRELWKTAEPLLRSPVRKRETIHVPDRRDLPGPLAGGSALAEYTMLAEPTTSTIAVNREKWKAIQKGNSFLRTMRGEEDALSVEVWEYAPDLLAHRGCVDRLSLYLSMRDSTDERVQAALDELLEEVPW